MIKKKKILLICSEHEFCELIIKLLEQQFIVLQASDEKEGLAKARTEHPEAIVLGFLEPQGTSFKLHKKLRNGWITKHIPLIVVDVDLGGTQQKVWKREEAMQMDAEDYILLKKDDSTSIFRLTESVGLIDKISDKLDEKKNPFKEAVLNPDVFCVTWEQIPGRGAFEMQQEKVIENVAKASEGGKVHAISVTDNPGGNPALSTEMLCAQIKKLGMEPLVHLACRDKNRNEIESMLYGIAAEGVRNLLVLTGDHTSSMGFEGKPKPVFDIDPVNTLRLIQSMNEGLEHQVMRKKVTLAQTDLFAGVCVSPFKMLESELIPQYYKLKKKIQAGAHFIINQIGYDARKLHELLQWLKTNNLNIPLLANIYMLPYGAAKMMNANKIPGCVVTDKLVAELAEEAKTEDKGKAARLLRAAKLYAIAKGMGCAGAHIGGHGMTYQMVEYIIEKGEELSRNWEDLIIEFDYPQKKGFYFFTKDPDTGLNRDETAKSTFKPRVPLIYRFARIIHALFFNDKSILFKMLQFFARWIDASPILKRLFEFQEHLIKVVMFDCMNCGDCGLFDVAYLCPMSQCPKEQRNGPCGGSYEGWCEVYPNEKKCIWTRAYQRLKKYKEEDQIGEHIVLPCNWELSKTSSWLNFYLGRDHTSKRLGIKPPQEKNRKKEEAKK